MTISVTFLSSYLYCKRKLYLEQVLGLKFLAPDVTVKGTIRHNVLDLISKQEKGIVLSISPETVSQAEDKYISFYSRNLVNSIKIQSNILEKHKINYFTLYNELWPWFKEDAKMRAKYVSDFIEKHKIYGNELWEKLTPKIITELFVQSEILELKGKIDRVEHDNQKYIPIEIKTGKAPSEGVWEAHMVQIGAYMMLLEDKLGKAVSEGKIHYLDSGERIIKMNPYLKEEIIVLKEKVKEVLSSKEVPDFCTNEKKCIKCPLKKECWEMGGRAF